MAHARLARGEARIRVQVEVRAKDLGEVAVDDDGAVHLRELEEAVRGKGDVQGKAVIASAENGLRVAHADERAEVPSDNHVERATDGSAGSSGHDCPLETFLEGLLNRHFLVFDVLLDFLIHSAPSSCMFFQVYAPAAGLLPIDTSSKSADSRCEPRGRSRTSDRHRIRDGPGAGREGGGVRDSPVARPRRIVRFPRQDA